MTNRRLGHYTLKRHCLVCGIFGSYTIKSWPIEPGIYEPAMAGKTKLVNFPAISGKIPCNKGIEAGQYFSAIAGNVRSYCREYYQACKCSYYSVYCTLYSVESTLQSTYRQQLCDAPVYFFKD